MERRSFEGNLFAGWQQSM